MTDAPSLLGRARPISERRVGRRHIDQLSSRQQTQLASLQPATESPIIDDYTQKAGRALVHGSPSCNVTSATKCGLAARGI